MAAAPATSLPVGYGLMALPQPGSGPMLPPASPSTRRAPTPSRAAAPSSHASSGVGSTTWSGCPSTFSTGFCVDWVTRERQATLITSIPRDRDRLHSADLRLRGLRSSSQMSVVDSVLGLWSSDMGIDLGTANTLVHVRGQGIVLNEPSVVAMSKPSNVVLSVGTEARKMLGRTPADIVAMRPLKDGVIADFDVTEQMIKYFIAKVHNRSWHISRPRAVLGVPSGVTEVEKRAVTDAAIHAGWPGALLGGGADGGRDRGRPADPGGDRLDDRGHRRRHQRGRRGLPGGHRRQQVDPHRRRRDGPGHCPVRPAQLQPPDR